MAFCIVFCYCHYKWRGAKRTELRDVITKKSLFFIRKGFKTPSHGKCPLGGYPPPPPGGLRTRFFCKVSEKNLTDKGGPPPPLTGPLFPKTQKKKKISERGGSPPPVYGRKIQIFFATSGIFWCFSPKKHCF